jgi:recombination protein RecR
MAEATLASLADALKCLPGVGPKTAQRFAYHLLQNDRNGAARLAHILGFALTNLRHCSMCNDFTEDDVCDRCRSHRRDRTTLCIVETPVDMNMVEQAHAYSGMYYILMGRISPLDGVGARDLHVERIVGRVVGSEVREVILATNFTNEGEATAHLLSGVLRKRGVTVSRIARGVPVGGELEFVDAGTLAQAVRERRLVE